MNKLTIFKDLFKIYIKIFEDLQSLKINYLDSLYKVFQWYCKGNLWQFLYWDKLSDISTIVCTYTRTLLPLLKYFGNILRLFNVISEPCCRVNLRRAFILLANLVKYCYITPCNNQQYPQITWWMIDICCKSAYWTPILWRAL